MTEGLVVAASVVATSMFAEEAEIDSSFMMNELHDSIVTSSSAVEYSQDTGGVFWDDAAITQGAAEPPVI